jgi:hypothetical protein
MKMGMGVVLAVPLDRRSQLAVLTGITRARWLASLNPGYYINYETKPNGGASLYITKRCKNIYVRKSLTFT